MILRAFSICVVISALGLSAFCFDAAFSARTATALIDAARNAQSDKARSMLLSEVSPLLTSAWSQPLSWHAGAMELQSGAIILLSADGGISRRDAGAARWTANSLGFAPVQPRAWLRLAILDHEGQPNSMCAQRVCLENSWSTGPMLDVNDACLRLQLEHGTGETISIESPHIRAFVAANPSGPEIARCLWFLPHQDQLELMLQARMDVLERKRARSATLFR